MKLMGLKREKMCINSSNVHWLPTSWNSSRSGVILCQCGFVQESNHWIVPTHLPALRVQLLVVPEDFGVWISRLSSAELCLQSGRTSFVPELLT